nr:putative reverse transcriptase domain-containing protein [Tanacetum cinerariifolium]
MTMKKVGDQTIRVIQSRRIDMEGNVSRFQEYHTSDEEEEELMTNNLNNGNGNGNRNGGGNNGCTYKGFVACGPRDFEETGGIDNDGVLSSNEIEMLEGAILTAGILTDEAVRSGTLAKAGEKRKERGEANEGDHENHLRLMLDLLWKEKLYVKFSKCKFWLQE